MECNGFRCFLPFIILATVAALFLYGAVCKDPKRHSIFKLLAVMGITGFFGNFLLGSIPIKEKNTLFQRVEFHSVGTVTIEAPDGRRYSAMMVFERIQRYNSEGQFELGWFVNSAGGLIAVGLTNNGNVAVASTRRRHVEVFTPDGVRTQPPIRYDGSKLRASFYDQPMRPGQVAVERLSLIEPIQTRNPRPSIIHMVMFFFWHPVLAWILAAVGFVPHFLAQIRSRRTAA